MSGRNGQEFSSPMNSNPRPSRSQADTDGFSAVFHALKESCFAPVFRGQKLILRLLPLQKKFKNCRKTIRVSQPDASLFGYQLDHVIADARCSRKGISSLLLSHVRGFTFMSETFGSLLVQLFERLIVADYIYLCRN